MYKVILVVSVILEVIGDILLKQWTLNKRSIFAGIFTYALGSFGWVILLKKYDLSKGLVVFTMMNLIFGIVAGVYFFKEELAYKDYVGILLAMIAIFIIEK